MSQVGWNDLLPVQNLPGGAKHIGAATATIAPTTFLTVMTAGAAVVTITPPVPGVHMLALMFADAAGTGGGGNIANGAVASVANRPMLLIYDPTTALYYVVTVA